MQSIQRKDREFGAVMAKIEDEASIGSKQQKQIKELAVSREILLLSIKVHLECKFQVLTSLKTLH